MDLGRRRGPRLRPGRAAVGRTLNFGPAAAAADAARGGREDAGGKAQAAPPPGLFFENFGVSQSAFSIIILKTDFIVEFYMTQLSRRPGWQARAGVVGGGPGLLPQGRAAPFFSKF